MKKKKCKRHRKREKINLNGVALSSRIKFDKYERKFHNALSVPRSTLKLIEFL